MIMVNCIICGCKISSDTKTCPNCNTWCPTPSRIKITTCRELLEPIEDIDYVIARRMHTLHALQSVPAKESKPSAVSDITTGDTITGAITLIVLVVLVGWFFCWVDSEELQATRVEPTVCHETERAEKYVRTYRIAYQSGEYSDARFEAHMAASYYLDAEDGINYRKWKRIEKWLDTAEKQI